MKLIVKDPIEAARRFGGATWEPGVGWWTYTTVLPSGMETAPRVKVRDAIYVPTVAKHGGVLDSETIFSLF